MKRPRKERVPLEDPGTFGLSLGEILRVPGAETPSPAPSAPPVREEPPPAPGAPRSGFGKVTLQRQSKGRGGHPVTVTVLEPPSGNLEELAKRLRKALGCGARVEEGRLVLQGDLVDRAKAWFEAAGATRVVVSGR
ncbi:translation initiation factor [Aminomonas paucivorans]|uniref:translation initiation factor n=1 Tax=Aminomonas paucivorans TaxID=81412 RepID=UPI003321F7E2